MNIRTLIDQHTLENVRPCLQVFTRLLSYVSTILYVHMRCMFMPACIRSKVLACLVIHDKSAKQFHVWFCLRNVVIK